MKRVHSFLRHPFVSGSAIMIFGNMFVNIINYSYHILMGRLLGPISYGALASVFSILYIISIVPLSANVAIVKFISSVTSVSELPSVYSGIRRFVSRLGITITVILVLLVPFIKNYLHIDSAFTILLVAPIFYFSLMAIFNQSVLHGMLSFFPALLPNVVSSVLKLILGVVLVLTGFKVFGAIFGIVLASFFAYLVSEFFVRRHVSVVPHTYNLSDFLRYSGPTLIQALALTSFITMDVLLVKHYLLEYDAGLYASLSTIGKVIYFAATPIASVMFPIISRRRQDNKSILPVFLGSLIVTFCVSIFFLILFSLFPNFIFGVTFGSKYIGFEYLLPQMGLFMTFYSLSNLLVMYHFSLSRTKVFIIPIFWSLLQVFGIILFHYHVSDVVSISIISSLGMLLMLVFYTIISYNDNR